MEEQNFGKLLKEIRRKNHLTQKNLAEKYHVTYQAVSKWERGLNLPDSSLIRQISNDFHISLEDLYDGKVRKNPIKKYIPLLFILLILGIGILSFLKKQNDFEFKTLTTTCDNFNISGNIAYNAKKSAIYIANIEYCQEDKTEYKKIECTLYEKEDNIEKRISTYSYQDDKTIHLSSFLKKVTFVVDNYENDCKIYEKNKLYLMIYATDKEDHISTYQIPLTLEEHCN